METNILEYDDYKRKYYATWQKKMLHVCWAASGTLLLVELMLIPVYIFVGNTIKQPLLMYCLQRVVLPSCISLTSVTLCTVIVRKQSVSQRRKNYAINFCLLTITGVVSLFHNYYQIFLMLPMFVIFVSVIFLDVALFNKISFFVFCILVVSLITWGLFETNGNLSLISGTAVSSFLIFFILRSFAKLVLTFVQHQTEYSYGRYRERSETLTAIRVDSLTNLYTRTTFNEMLSDNIGANKEVSNPLILMLAKIDDMRNANAVYGKENGNDILKSFSELLKYAVNDNRNIFRYSGNTFAVLFTNQSLDAVKDMAHILCSSFSATHFTFSGETPSFTASVGIARYFSGMSAAEFLDDAKKALHKAKAQGKNNVVISPLSESI
ncbi:MAG: diguanylate cyclase [Treponema sp.]|nr:diguanylate cyclase [Treponema sp.]